MLWLYFMLFLNFIVVLSGKDQEETTSPAYFNNVRQLLQSGLKICIYKSKITYDVFAKIKI